MDPGGSGWVSWAGVCGVFVPNKSANPGLGGLTGHAFGVCCAVLAQEAQLLSSPVSSCAGVGRNGVPRRSLSLQVSSPPCRGHPDGHIQMAVAIVGWEPSSWRGDGQGHTVSSLSPHCTPLHGLTRSEHPDPGPLPFRARLTTAFGGFSLRAGPGAGLGERRAIRNRFQGFVGLETELCRVAVGGTAGPGRWVSW